MEKLKIDWLDVAFFVTAAITISLLAVLDLHQTAAMYGKLPVLRLNNWSVLSLGSLHVLSYPAACKFFNMSAPNAANLSSAVLITCPPDSYVAIVTNGDYDVACNATEAYRGWGMVGRYYGYAYVYYGVKALSCIEISVSSLQNYLLGYGGGEGGHIPAMYWVYVDDGVDIPAMYWGAYGKIILDSWAGR
jgi:hypothetical protein